MPCMEKATEETSAWPFTRSLKLWCDLEGGEEGWSSTGDERVHDAVLAQHWQSGAAGQIEHHHTMWKYSGKRGPFA